MFNPINTLKMIYLLKRPFLLHHKVNIACDCRCNTCDSWKIEEPPESLLNRAEIKDLIERASRAGMLSYSAWGGEPLLREDTPELLAHARSRGMFTTLSTNGSLLARREDELIACTNLFLISLDGIGKTHDQARGHPGLFDKVMNGISKIRARGGKIRLFYNVHMKSVDEIKAAAVLAKDLKVSIFFFPILMLPGHNESILLERETEREAFRLIADLKKQGYPILNLNSYLRVIEEKRKITCRFPRYHIYVDYDGTLYTCDLGPSRKLAVWGDAREVDLVTLFKSREYRSKVREFGNCNACRLLCGEIGAGSPLRQFPVRALTRLRHEGLS